MNTLFQSRKRLENYLLSNKPIRHFHCIRLIIRDITELYADIKERRDRLSTISHEYGANEREDLYSEELDEVESSIYKDIDILKGYISELTGLGIELKDPETGLIDFPSLQQGREVYLCWKMDEESVSFWHELDAGFSGRQPL